MPTDNNAYRQNVQNRESAWHPGTKATTSWRSSDNPTSKEVYARISQIYDVDKEKGLELANKFQKLQSTPTSQYYNPYAKSTNQAIGNLASMGIDASGMNTEWFNNNRDWQKYLVYNGTTNTPSSPGKKATAQQYAAYQMYQISKAAETTDKVDSEWAAMQQEIFYWTQRKDLNLSDDDIIARIEKEKQTKYPTLYALDKSRQPGQAVMELNHGTTYSKDNMYGAIWAARNGKSDGSMLANNILSAGGKGNTWQADEKIAAKMDRSNLDTYSPFSVGMTADDIGMYFNVTGINDKMLAEIENTIDWGNETDVKMYNKAKDALATTKKAEAEKADLMKQINGWLESGMREDKIKERLNTLLSGNNYPTLKAMDKSINDRQNREDMVQTTYAVDYRKQDIEKYITDTYRYLSSMRSANSIASAGFVSRKSTKTPEQVQEEAIAAWKEQHKTTDEYTNDQLRQVRTQQQAADVSKEGQVPANQQMPTEAEMEAAYDAVHGKGAFKSDMKAGNDVTSAKSAMDAKDQNVRDAYAIVKDATNNAERSVLQGYTGSRQAVQTMMREQRDEWLANGIPEDVMANQTQDSNRGYIESAIGYVPGITKYEEASNSIEKLEKSIAENKEKLGLKWYIGRTNDLTFETELGGNKYRVTMLPDLSDVESIESFDENGNARPVRLGMFNEGPEEDAQIWEAVRSGSALNAFREKYLAEEKNIQAAAGLEITPEDEELRSKIRNDEMALEDAKAYVEKNQDQYSKDKAEMERAQQRRDEYIKRLEAMGADTTSLKIADTVLDSLYSFNDYDATRWEEYNPTHIYTSLLDLGMEKDTVLDMARKEHNEIIEQLKDIEFLEQYLNDNNIALPGDKTGEHDVYGQKIARNSDVWNNIQRRKAKLQRDLKDAEFFEMQFSSDFEQVANGQKEQEKIDFVNYNATHKTNNPYEVPGSLYSAFGNYQNYLTEDEKNTWYYLKAKDNQNGTNKADEYAAFMNDDTYGVLPTRAARGMEEGAKGLTESGVGSFAFTNALAIIMSPYNAVSSALYYAKNAITGDEFNPNSSYLRWSQFRTATREQSAQEILETFGKKDENGNYDQTTFSKIVQGAYEILTNRLDSATNAFTFGAMFGGIGNNMLQEFASAMPMGIAASAEAAARAKEKGATDAQAYGIAAITCFAETATEAISLENMSKALKLGKEAGGGTWKAFLKNWLTKAGLSEAFGESVNDIVENIADEKIMGELSEHSEKVKAYRELGYSPDEAEMMARKDELSGVLRTALISYLSPGLDAFQTAAGRYQYYKAATKEAQSNGQNVSLRQVRQQILKQERQEANAEKQEKKAEKEAKKAKPTFTRTETQQQTPTTQSDVMVSEEEARQAMEAKAKTPEMTAAEKFTVDYEILETANGADKSVQTSSVAAVLDNGATQEGTDIANAAATNLADIVQEGKTVPEEVQDLLIGADMAKMDAENVKRGIVYAALGGEESECRQLMQSDAYQNASMDRKATMLVEAMGRDWQNPTIAENVNRNTREYRVACVEGQLMEQGGAITIVDAETEAEVAAMEVDKAQKALDTQKEMEENARRAVTRISHDDLTLNPANDAMTKSLMSALDKLQKQAAVSREYAQSLKNAQDREQAARENVEKVKQNVLTDIRQQAEDAVAQEDQQRLAANQQAQDEAQEQAVQEEKQRVQQEAENNANVADVDNFIEMVRKENPNLTPEDEQVIRDKFTAIQKEAQSRQTEIEDERGEDGKLTDRAKLARNKALFFVNSKFGLPVVLADDITTEDENGVYSEGFYDEKNHRIVVSNDLSFEEIMTRVLPHELLHSLEKAGTYNSVANSLLGTIYGKDADIEQAIKNLEKNNGKATTRLEQDIVQIKKKYDTALKGNYSYRYAAQEIAATRMGEMFYNPNNPQKSIDLINRLAAEKPSAAKQIMNSIKSMVKKALGMKGAWLTNAQKTVDLFEKALSQNKTTEAKTDTSVKPDYHIMSFNSQKGHPVVQFNSVPDASVDQALRSIGMKYRNDNGKISYRTPNNVMLTETAIRNAINEVKHSLPEERIAKPAAEDSNGDVLTETLEDGTNVKYSLSSWTNKEIKTVRKNLLKNGFTAEEADRWINDVNSIAAVIAADKDRLDFIPDRDQKFKKPNGDVYKWTLDASTLCAKRLLYQGTFNAIQQALPNTPLRPGDLIELANMMHEMGYQTPCGICYVESRRRHLGNFTEEFLADYKGEYKPTYAELTSTEGLAKLKQEHRQAYDDYIAAMNGKGVASPKVVQLRTDYRGDVRNLNKDSIAYLNSIGGLRIQSFSDFETPHLMDMMQAVIDMAAVKLKSQAYTKVPNFAWVFGDTGIKINLSLMGEGTGVDENGNLVFSNTEGMDFEEAMKLRDQYSQNVGTILVGMNDEHIIAAMGDGRIDYIIPFHKSGWSQEELDKMQTLANYTDYQDTQNELWITGQNEDGSYITKSIDKKTGNLDPYSEDSAWKWDYSKSGQANAEEYLRVCAEQKRLPKFSQFLVDNGNGTFSLPKGDDTRSTNIREGYWKTLIDFKMYENDSYGRAGGEVKGAPQTEVTPNINMPQAYRVLNDYEAPEGGNNALPVADPVVERYVEWYKETHQNEKKYSLPTEQVKSMSVTDFDKYIQTLSIEEMDDLAEELFGIPLSSPTKESSYDTEFEEDSDEEEVTEEDVREVITAAVKDIKNEFDPTIYNGRLYVKPETLNYWLSGSKYASSDPNYSRAYIAMMDPADFVRMTTTRPEQQQRIYDESVPLDNGVREGKVVSLDENAKDEPIQLVFNEDTGKIEGHQGRHRSVALARAGVTQMPVVLIDERESAKYTKTPKAEMTLEAQNPRDRFGFEDTEVRNGNMLTLNDVIPIASGNRDELFKRFTASPEEEADAAANNQRILRYSLPEDGPYLAAVERGDMDEAQRMVDEKAKETGYNIKAYHGTGSNFTSFDPQRIGKNYHGYSKYGKGFYFSDVESVANEWGNGRKVMDVYLKMDNPYILPFVEYEGPLLDEYNRLQKKANPNFEPSTGEAGGYLIAKINELTKKKGYSTDFLKSLGYDGIIVHHVGRDAGATAPWSGTNEYVIFDNTNIKSADPVTYDDNGNIIPPSERFNDQNNDIRYSLPSDDILEQQIRQYLRNGGVLSNQNPNTSPTPRFNQLTEKQTGYRQWGNEGAQQSDELFQQVKDTVLNSEYTKDTNAAQLNRALDWIQGNRSKYDPDGYITSLQKLINNKNSYRTKDGQAKMVAMMALAAAKGDVSGQVDLADIYNKQGTALGQALQARKLFKLMTPEGRIASLRKMISDQQQFLDGRGVDVELKLSDAVYQAAAYATKEGEFDKVRQAALEELAQQIPASWKDKMRSWRMLSMLANPRTHIRNMVGNALFVPAVGIKNKLGAVAEQAFGTERTKTTSILLDKDIRDFARQDAVKMKDVLTGEAKFSETSQIAKSQTKLGKFLDAISNKNSEWLEKEDWFFLKGHYRRALGGWMQANGYTVEQMNANPELLEQGREYAIAEAQKATYRDFNKTASMLNEVSRKGGLPGFIVDAALPFKKTPANILKRGIEYSPVGLVKSLTADMIHMKQYLDAVKNDKAIPDKALSPTQVVDHLCAGLSGTAITILGFLLAGSGAVTCGLDDDEDKLKKLKGAQEYSIKLFGTDVTFTMDWAAPMSMPFFVGAAIRDQFDKEGGADINEVVNALGNIAEPVFNLSMLDGVNSLFKTSQYDDTNALTQILAKIVTNYGTSYVPSALGATTRTLFDDTRRKSYVTTGENTGIEGTLRYAWEQVENKIPGLSTTNIPYRDVWGNAETSGLAERIFENFISPGYVNNYKDDLVVNELSRLYEATGDAAMIPEEAKKSITYKNTKYNLSPEDYDKLVVTRGQAAYNGLAQLMNSDVYKRASAEEQKEQVKKVWSYADQLGKAAVIPDYKITAATSVDEAATSGTVAYYQDAMITSLDSGDYTAYDTCIQALHDSGYEDNKIKTKISNTYRDKYKDAYRKKDYVTMLDIEDMLDRTGYDFDYQKWQDQVDENG